MARGWAAEVGWVVAPGWAVEAEWVVAPGWAVETEWVALEWVAETGWVAEVVWVVTLVWEALGWAAGAEWVVVPGWVAEAEWAMALEWVAEVEWATTPGWVAEVEVEEWVVTPVWEAPGWVVVTRTDPVEVACKGGADITGLLSLPKFLKSYVGGCFNERLQTTHLNHGRSDAPVAFLLQSPSLIPFVMSRASSAWVALILTQTRMTGFFSGLLMESNNRDAC